MSIKRIFFWSLVFISLLAIFSRYSEKLAEIFLGIKQTSGISILSEPTGATVFLDDKEVGKTPYKEKDLDVGSYTVKLQKDQSSWQGKIQLNADTIGIIERDLAPDTASSAGEILTLTKGSGITVISNPSDADIEIDGKAFGKSPKTIDVPSGKHTIVVMHPNYLNRSIGATLPDNLNLIVSVDLALSEADLTTIATPVITQTPQLLVKDTPTGFLRVRDKPSLNGKELTQVKTGDSLILLEEQADWDRVRLPDGVEGYVSAAYVEKTTTPE